VREIYLSERILVAADDNRRAVAVEKENVFLRSIREKERLEAKIEVWIR
jgi:hypothetical protein